MDDGRAVSPSGLDLASLIKILERMSVMRQLPHPELISPRLHHKFCPCLLSLYREKKSVLSVVVIDLSGW